jgi:hypothetical protein
MLVGHEPGCGDRVAAAIQGGMRRHRERGALNQHGKDRVDISGRECIGEAAHEIADSSIAEGTQGCRSQLSSDVDLALPVKTRCCGERDRPLFPERTVSYRGHREDKSSLPETDCPDHHRAARGRVGNHVAHSEITRQDLNYHKP